MKNLKQRIHDAFGREPESLRPFAGGNNSRLYLADFADGARLVAKFAESKTAKLDVEGWMLFYLREHSQLPVPDVMAADPDFLLISYIEDTGRLDGRAQENAAEILAALHSIHADEYGLERDTLIGPLDQPNTREKDWLTFFREHRLFYMARKALEEGVLDNTLMRRIEKLADRLDEWISEPAPPSLIHGDVWGGNVLTAGGGVSGFIDPAIYYADPEIELAFSTLFSTFGEPFFVRYNEITPMRPGFFEVRRDLYNLYPLLVHARLFGPSYTLSVDKIVRRFAG